LLVIGKWELSYGVYRLVNFIARIFDVKSSTIPTSTLQSLHTRRLNSPNSHSTPLNNSSPFFLLPSTLHLDFHCFSRRSAQNSHVTLRLANPETPDSHPIYQPSSLSRRLSSRLDSTRHFLTCYTDLGEKGSSRP